MKPSGRSTPSRARVSKRVSAHRMGGGEVKSRKKERLWRSGLVQVRAQTSSCALLARCLLVRWERQPPRDLHVSLRSADTQLQMAFVRTGLERLLLFGFAAARSAFLLQGLAFGCAWLVTRALAPADAPPWLRDVMLSALLLSGILFAAGVLLVAARGWGAPPIFRGGRRRGS